MSILDHVGFSAADYPRSRAFYAAALAPLGITELMDFDVPDGKIAGFGRDRPEFWVGDGGRLGGRTHLAFAARSRAEVDAFYAAAIAAGGRDNGPPGIRAHYHPDYYAAFVFDPDGINVEAVFHGPQ